MNSTAQKHLAAAKDFVARGEAFYRKAAEEIVAAQSADTTLGTREIGEWFGRSHTWVQDIVRWHTTGKSTRGGSEDAPTPYAEQQGAVARRHAKSVLREAPAEEIAEILASDPAIAKNVAKAVRHHDEKKHEELAGRVDAKQRAIHGDESQDRVEKHERDIEVLNAAHQLRSRTLHFLKALFAADLSDEVADEVAELLEDVRDKAAMGLDHIKTGESFDDELTRLLAEERS